MGTMSGSSHENFSSDQDKKESAQTILPPQKTAASKTNITTATQQQKQKFSWDDPDIVPIEDKNS